MAIKSAAHPAEMRPMTRGDRVLDLLSGASGMLVGNEMGGVLNLVALGDIVVEDELEDDEEEEEVEAEVVDEVADGIGTSVPFTLSFVPMKMKISMSIGWVSHKCTMSVTPGMVLTSL